MFTFACVYMYKAQQMCDKVYFYKFINIFFYKSVSLIKWYDSRTSNKYSFN